MSLSTKRLFYFNESYRHEMNILEHKYQYYREWFLSMSITERLSDTGKWVFERIAMFSELLRQQEKEAQAFKARISHYKNVKHV